MSKVRRYEIHFGEAYEELVRMALTLLGDVRASDTSAEVVVAGPWHSSDRRPRLVDALLKLQALGVPNQALWQLYGANILQQIESWRAHGSFRSRQGTQA